MPDSFGLRTRLRDVIGGKSATAVSKAFGYEYVQDVLLHLPRRYAVRGELTPLSELIEGEHATIMARVQSVETRPMRQRRGSITEVVVTDGSSDLSLTFFRRPPGKISRGSVGLFAGKVSSFRQQKQLTHPEIHMLGADADEQEAAAFADQLVPIYPANAALSSIKMSRIVGMTLDQLTWADQQDPIPSEIRTRHGFMSVGEAFEAVHRPKSIAESRKGLERIRYSEALALQTVLALRRRELAGQRAIARVSGPNGSRAEFDESLPFTLTTGQAEVGLQIEAELASEQPMHRLLQGEVGSGKTLVAVRAMLTVVESGGQAALLAPTEVLANQHERAIRDLLGPLADSGLFSSTQNPVNVTLLTGSMSTARRRQAMSDIASGQAGIVVGTHSLLADKVTFADLGLVVVDEQHRFGVEQRAALAAKARDGVRPHVLVMTATPIPRTVAITVFGDLDVSTLKELPAGRSPISTHLVPTDRPAYLARTWERVSEEVEQGRQAYVVCPRISTDEAEQFAKECEISTEYDLMDEPGPTVPPASVEFVFDQLSQGPLSGLRLAMLHGRLATDDASDVMARFTDVHQDENQGSGIDVLVATTVIEVGVDVPNATVMVVMDADKFGISQLHQLRGRVGRGVHPGLCLLVSSAPEGSVARQRLDAVAGSTDGFELSRRDLEFRREGDVLGSDQSGLRSSLKVLSLLRDEAVIVAAKADADQVVADDPELLRHVELAALVRDLTNPDAAEWLEKS